MTELEKAAKQALKALCLTYTTVPTKHLDFGMLDEAITALRRALEQQLADSRCKHGVWAADHCFKCEKQQQPADYDQGWKDGYKHGAWASEQQPAEEPVAWTDGYRNIYSLEEKAAGCEDAVIPLYPHPVEHWSDCAVNNEPAYPAGECDCGGYARPQAREPQFREFIKWAGAQGYDCAQTCNSDTGEWICLNPMTADLWKAWQAAHGTGKKK